FDHADHGLDRDGYASLYRLLSHIKGLASMVLVSDDANIAALADRAFALEGGTLRPTSMDAATNLHAYPRPPA
ncbi:MAG: hypothetical protein AAGF49_07200, partial [Pseudomonadota bacterium]